MSTVNNGPQIVRSGLILDLDASYMRSYSPNVLPKPTDIFDWCQNAGFNACTVSRDRSMTRQYGSIPLKMVVSGNDPYIVTYSSPTFNLATAANGQTWTVSVYVKASVATTGELFIFGADIDGYYGGVGTYGSSGAITITTSWTRVSFTTTMSGANVAFIQVRLDGPNTGGSGQTIWWDGLQVERASSATTFNPYYFGNTAWKDISGNNRTGTLTNGPLFNTSNYGSIAFDGSDDYVTGIGSSIVPTSTAPYTVSVWCYRNTNNSSYKELLAQWTNANSGNSFFFGFDNSAVRFTDNWNPITVAGAGNTNVWMNLVGVYTVSNAYIYLNGVLAATKGSGFTYTGTGPLIIGRQGELNGEYFDGRISNVLIYNRALAASEISQNYEADKTRFGL